MSQAATITKDPTALAGLSSGRRAVLTVVARHGEADAETVSQALFLSASAARQQLAVLESERLLARRRPVRGRGRPRNLYHLTPSGEAFFPQSPAGALAGILSFLEANHPVVLEHALGELARQHWPLSVISLAGEPGCPDGPQLAQVFEERGFLATASDCGATMRLRLGHCPLVSAARSYPRLCAAEHEALSAAFPACDVRRVAHRLDDTPVCEYELSPVHR